MDSTPFREQVVLVTGASSGIGRALAAAFAAQGAHVILIARTESDLRVVERQLAVYPGQRLALPCDVREPQEVQRAVQTALTHFGRVDVLVNNAGKGYCGELASMPAADLHDLFATNFFGAVYFYQAIVPQMLQRRRGQIIQISSVSGFLAVPLGGGYSATKFALEAFSDSARLELQAHGIRVLVVRPGFTDTAFFDHAKNFRTMNPFPEHAKMSPEKLAGRVLRATASGRRELVLTADGKFSYFLKRLAPSLLDRLVVHYVKARPAATP